LKLRPKSFKSGIPYPSPWKVIRHQNITTNLALSYYAFIADMARIAKTMQKQVKNPEFKTNYKRVPKNH
jgi:hypothetical protein